MVVPLTSKTRVLGIPGKTSLKRHPNSLDVSLEVQQHWLFGLQLSKCSSALAFWFFSAVENNRFLAIFYDFLRFALVFHDFLAGQQLLKSFCGKATFR